MTKLRDHVLAHIPRCLADVCATPVPLIEDRGAESVAFVLSHVAGGDTGEVHGYDLRDYNPDFNGPCEFVSPLAIKWPDIPPVVIFDSDVHGYHGAMNASAKLRGEGHTQAFLCPKCSGKLFAVYIQLDYWDACNDLWDDEPEIRIQDYFCNIMVAGTCVECRHISRVLDMDL